MDMNNQQQQTNSIDISNNKTPFVVGAQAHTNQYNKIKQRQQNQLAYMNSNSSSTGVSNNPKINMFSAPSYTQQYNSLKNSYNNLSGQLNQRPLVQSLTHEQMSQKKSDGRTNSQHQLQQHNQTFTTSSGQMFSNILQNIDNSKSTDTSPQVRAINNNANYNSNQLISQLSLNKPFPQQLTSSKSLIQSSNNSNANLPQNQVYTNGNGQYSLTGSQTSKHSKNSSQTQNQFAQQIQYLNNLYPFSNYTGKDGYFSQNSSISHQMNQPQLSIQKPMSANYSSNQQQTVYLSPTKKVNHNLANNIANSKLMNSISKSYQEINKSNTNSKIFLDNKQQNKEEQLLHLVPNSLMQKEEELQNGKNKIQFNIDIYSQAQQYQRNQIVNGDSNNHNNNITNNNNNHNNQNDNQITSSNVTEEEGAKLYTLESGSIKSQQQNQKQPSYNQTMIQYEKEARILQLEKDNSDMQEKVKNLEQQLVNSKHLLETQVELERYKLKEYYENQNQIILQKLKQENTEREQSQNIASPSKDNILVLLQSVMSQNEELFKQYKWIQDKLCEQDSKDDKQQISDILKSDRCQVSLENIVPMRSQNNTSPHSTFSNKKLYPQAVVNSNPKHPSDHQSKLEAEIINEEDDCSTGTNQDLVKKSKMRSDYQQNKDNSRGTNEDNSMVNSNGYQNPQEKANEKSFNEELTSSSASPYIKKKSNRNGSVLLTQEGRIEELERIIGVKNHEIQDLKEKLYEAKDYLMQHFPNAQRINIPPALTQQDIYPQKRRKSFSSSSDLHSLASLTNMRKPIQNSIMEWSYSFDCSGSVEKLMEEGWRIQEHHCKVNLQELNQVIGVVGMPKTGKTTIINGLMKGNLQTVEELKKATFFEPKLNIVLDENIAIFEYSYMQPIQIENQINISTSSIADLTQSKQFSTLMEEQVAKTNKRDFFWIDYFIKNTNTLIVVFDKFTQEEQKMLNEILNRIESEEDLLTKELILIHNYYSKGLRSAQELQQYFGQSLQHIDSNFKQKLMVELKMYKTVLIQKHTKSKKCTHITHILNGNLFEPFADKYQHNMLQYCMDKISQVSQTSKRFMPTFESFLQKNIASYLSQNNNISSFQQIDNQKIYQDFSLQFDNETSSLMFKQM